VDVVEVYWVLKRLKFAHQLVQFCAQLLVGAKIMVVGLLAVLVLSNH
jgi:hypothetical protein